MKGPGQKRTRQQDAAIIGLLTAPTLAEAAQQAHISELTLWRWLREPEFQAAYREARRQAVQQAIARIQQATSTAVKTLESVMQSTKAPSSSRVSAARAVLEMALKGAELEDLTARIEALEHAVHERRNGHVRT